MSQMGCLFFSLAVPSRHREFHHEILTHWKYRLDNTNISVCLVLSWYSMSSTYVLSFDGTFILHSLVLKQQFFVLAKISRHIKSPPPIELFSKVSAIRPFPQVMAIGSTYSTFRAMNKLESSSVNPNIINLRNLASNPIVDIFHLRKSL